ncbi:MAG: prepilin-type N-terminal cleavage/methylation domain-containing protein [Phycisphaerales bacterium]|nr:prepilin-type N-terminal cleavage/methylation domain-containing protein [Phycisphaerales bacterium]
MATIAKRTGVTRRAFTLIELIAVLVVLAILSGIALPKYLDYAARARASALQGALGGVRTGVASYYANASVSGTATYPTLAQLETLGTVMQEAIPVNPYNGSNDVVAATQAQAAARTIIAGGAGWAYYVDNAATPPEAVFYANTADTTTVDDPSGGYFDANEL